MALNRIAYPTTPTPVSGDWAKIVDLVQTGYLKMEDSLRIDYDNDDVLEGAVFHVAGTVYLADSDTAITGTPSDYVKITPSGATAAASYVANLTGVTWNDTYNGYYDVSNNLYVFDEDKAYYGDDISTFRTFKKSIIDSLGYFGKGYISLDLTELTTTTAPQIAIDSIIEIDGELYRNESAITITGSVSNSTWYDILLTPSGKTFTASYVARGTGVWNSSKGGLYSGNNRVVACVYVDGSGGYINKNILKIINRTISIKIETGDWDMIATNFITVAHGVTAGNIRSIIVEIRNDLATTFYNLAGAFNSLSNGYYTYDATNVRIDRLSGGIFASSSFDSISYNRGWIHLIYEV